MADVTGITAVRITSTTNYEEVTCGATISAGQPLYLDDSDQEHKLADANAEGTAKARGIAITPGVDGGGGLVARSGAIVLVGATLAVGENYVVSDTAGAIMPEADLSTGEYCTTLGRASSTTQLELNIQASGIAHA
jgi:hypothetical protein